jgi:tripartite-type tricarboxylate transporter receptor subunit TctC
MKPADPHRASDASRIDLPRRRLMALATTAAVVPRLATAQGAWPNKPVRVIVTNPPGGLTDAYARQYSEAMSRKFGQPFVVDNRPGAGGIIAADALAKSPADGGRRPAIQSSDRERARFALRSGRSIADLG